MCIYLLFSTTGMLLFDRRFLVIVILSVTVCVNVMFIMDVNHKLREEGFDGDHNGEAGASNSLGNGPALSPFPRSLTIEVYSSQSKVSVNVDGTVVIN